jgi:hypothetical protein
MKKFVSEKRRAIIILLAEGSPQSLLWTVDIIWNDHTFFLNSPTCRIKVSGGGWRTGIADPFLKYDVLRGVGVKMQIVMHEWAALQGSNTPNCLAVAIRRMAGKYEEGSRRISIFKLRFQAETFSGVVGLGKSGDYYGAPIASGSGRGL